MLHKCNEEAIFYVFYLKLALRQLIALFLRNR